MLALVVAVAAACGGEVGHRDRDRAVDGEADHRALNWRERLMRHPP
jgi:hypothetical protein